MSWTCPTCTSKFQAVWFRDHRSGLGAPAFGGNWFAVLLQPFLMLASSPALLTLYLTGQPWGWTLFRALWIISGLVT